MTLFRKHFLPPLLAFAAVSLLLEIWVRLASVSKFIMPAPSEILTRVGTDRALLIGEGAQTLLVAAAGFAVGSAIALAIAALVTQAPWAEKMVMPVVLLVKVTPIVALVPLLIIWFGFGWAPKIATCALIVFFPVLINAITGFRSVSPRMLEFLQSVSASRIEIFLKLRIPSALPYLFSAFRTAIPLSIIGAVLAEYWSADRGLGRLILLANNDLDTTRLFAGVFILAVMGVALTGILAIIERRVLFWHESAEPL